MSILGLNAKDCQRRAANSDNTQTIFSEISEKVNAAVDKGLGCVTVDVYLPSYRQVSDDEIASVRRNVVGAIENDGFKVKINEVGGRWMNITIIWHDVSDENDKALFEFEREIATKEFEHVYRNARARVQGELFKLRVKALELNPDYLETVENVKRLEDEKHEIMLTGALGFVRDWKHACELRKRYAKVRDEFNDAMRKYNTYRKSIYEIKVHAAVDVLHAREVLQNLILYGFNRK